MCCCTARAGSTATKKIAMVLVSTIIIICVLAYSASVGSVATGVAVAEHMDNQRERRDRNRYNRKKSITWTTVDDVRAFHEWFQLNHDEADKIVCDIKGILDAPCTIPQLGVSFVYNDVVIQLTYNGTYAVTVSADTMADIRDFWSKEIL